MTGKKRSFNADAGSDTNLSVNNADTVTSNERDEDAISVQEDDPQIKDIEGIGPTTAKKLREAGIVSVIELAVE